MFAVEEMRMSFDDFNAVCTRNDDRRHHRCVVTSIWSGMCLFMHCIDGLSGMCLFLHCVDVFLSLLFVLLFVQTLFPSIHGRGINVVCQRDNRSLLQDCSFAQRHWKRVEHHHHHTQAVIP